MACARFWGAMSRSILPPNATDMPPVSSETTTTIASDVSVMPMAARWRHGQDALGRYDTVVHDDRCAVVQRRVLEKYVLQQRHRQLRVEGYASVDYVAQVALLRQHHERARLRRRHLDAGRYDGLERGFCAVPRVEYVVYEVESLAAHSDHLQEVAQLGLEHYYDGYHAHADYLAEDGRQQLHSKRARDHPHYVYDYYAREYVGGVRAARHAVETEHEQSHEQNIDQVDECERYEIHFQFGLWVARYENSGAEANFSCRYVCGDVMRQCGILTERLP